MKQRAKKLASGTDVSAACTLDLLHSSKCAYCSRATWFHLLLQRAVRFYDFTRSESGPVHAGEGSLDDARQVGRVGASHEGYWTRTSVKRDIVSILTTGSTTKKVFS